MARCAAIKQNGERCKVEAIPDAEWCWSHHPEYAEARRRRASKGGKSGGRGRPAAALAQMRSRLVELAELVMDGDADPRRAGVASQLYNVAIRARSVELAEREQLELVERLERLEAELKLREGGNTWRGYTTG